MRCRLPYLLISLIILSNDSPAQEKQKNRLLDRLNMIKKIEERKDFTKKDTTRNLDNTRIEKRFYDFWINKLDKSGNAVEYAQYFAQKYATISNATVMTNHCSNNCYNHNWRYFGPEKTTPIGEPNKEIQVNGMVNCIWVHPTNDQHIRLGAKGGLWETKDGGSNWISLTDASISGISVNYIAVQPDNPNVMYISTGLDFAEHRFGYGIYKSSDAGVTWQRLNFVPINDVVNNVSSKILIHPNSYNVLYAIVGYKVYKSVDFGNNWGVIFSDVFPAGIAPKNTNQLFLRDIEIAPNGGIDNIYISAERKDVCSGKINTNQPGVCYSRDPNTNTYSIPCPPNAGSSFYTVTQGSDCATAYTAMTWRIIIPRVSVGSSLSAFTPISVRNLKSWINYPDRTSLSLVSVTNTYVYVLAYDYNQTTGKIYRANKLGGTFTLLFNLPNLYFGTNAPYGCTFDVSPNETNIYIGGTQLFRQAIPTSTGTFAPTFGYGDYISNSNAPHVDIRSSVVYKSTANPNQDVLFLGTDGGISKSTTSGTSFMNLTGNGLQLTDVWGISNSEKYPGMIAFGAQDNGLFFNSTHNWNWTYFGDGYDCITDNSNQHDIIASYNNYGPIKVNGITGARNTLVPILQGGNCEFFQDGLNNLYVGKEGVLSKYNTATNSGTQVVSSFLNSNGAISGLELTKSNDEAYVCFNGITWGALAQTGYVYKITGLTTPSPVVTDITNGLDGFLGAPATDLAIEPVSGNKVWVSYGGSWDPNRKVMMFKNNQWVQYGQGLPNIPVNAIEYYEGSNDLLFVGTDDGVYYRNVGMPAWEKFSCGLPGVIVTDLEINYKLKQLRAATVGRGVWLTQIPTQ